jgi:hypothetical protein
MKKKWSTIWWLAVCGWRGKKGPDRYLTGIGIFQHLTGIGIFQRQIANCQRLFWWLVVSGGKKELGPAGKAQRLTTN